MTTTPDLPPPADATRVDRWERWSHDDYRRFFTVTEQHTSGRHPRETFTVSVRGEQRHTGPIERWAYVDCLGERSAPELRVLAAALLNAADELDRLRA